MNDLSNYSKSPLSSATSGGGLGAFRSQTLVSRSKDLFFKAVVVDCVTDVSKYNKDYLSKIQNKFELGQFEKLSRIPENNVNLPSDDSSSEDDYYLIAPRNSVIIKFLKNFSDKDKKGDLDRLCVAYPFFSSHLILPCKPGEIIWCFRDTDSSGDEYYWMSRVHGLEYVEDANYTHLDRKNLINYPVNLSADLDDFLNGTQITKNFRSSDDNQDFTLAPIDQSNGIDQNSNPFDLIIKNSIFKDKLSLEPVPRITPKVGDLVIQGSNNNAIILTTNRAYDSINRPEPELSNSSEKISLNNSEPFNGCIDLVVGRGRFPNQTTKSPEEIFRDLSRDPNSNSTPLSFTTPRVYLNSRDYYETEKNPIIKTTQRQGASNIALNAPEGDPDLINDSARVYISNKMSVDRSLGLDKKYPEIVESNDASNSKKPIILNEMGSAALIKADEVRIVSRSDSQNGIKGSVKIVKEGQNPSFIMMEDDGTILINGPKIVIGTGKGEVNGQGTQISLGYGASEPLVLGNQLVDKLNRFIDEVVKLLEALTIHTHPTPAGPSTPPVDPTTWSENIVNLTLLQGELTEVLSTIGKTI
jgi:hypothetical protein